MEKKFKHRKTGYIATQLEDGRTDLYNYECGTMKYVILLSLLEDSCDWEEIIEEVAKKDYEILSVLQPHINSKYTLIKNKQFGISYNGDVYHCNGANIRGFDMLDNIKTSNWKIHSVKRLSDGEIFSIGDKITFKGLFGNNSEHKYDTIKGFKFKQDKKIGALYHNGIVGLEIIEKYKEPIFTTEDGVDLFGGESVYGVTDSFQLAYTSILTEENGQRCRLFAEKEKAEKYIEENKPQYSQKDVENAIGGDFFCKSVEGLLIKNVVLELLKTKISEPLQAL
jgi:hypothetical protein